MIYQELKSKNENLVSFDEDIYKKYSRPLAALEAQHYIKGGHALGKNYVAGIRLVDPSYILYLCALEEDSEKMDSLIRIVDNCNIGEWLDGNEIRKSTMLSLTVIVAVFRIYESKGYGVCSNEIGSCKYLGKA